jgi:CMP-N-acetylneuraminic acid synthetase
VGRVAKAGGTVAIVPARGGSKGVPRKNLRMLRGRPLIDYSIRAGLDARQVDRVIVSTEDREIAKVAQVLGAEVIDRPAALAEDAAPMMDVVVHALGVLERGGRRVEVVVLLQPTSPLRTAGDVDAAVSRFKEGGCDSVVSVCRAEHPPQWSFTLEGGLLRPLLDPGFLRMRRQDLPETYTTVGAIFVSTPSFIRKSGSFFAGRTAPYVMPPERGVDIDTEVDLALAELLLGRAGPG